jgi:hypothetical protein
MGHPAAASVQRQHAPAVLANQLLPAHRWGQPCRAYNVCIRPGPTAAAALTALQASALRLEPALLRVPEPALHANLAWLLPVHQEFDLPKDELWQRHGPQWTATLADAAARTSSFRLSYRHLVATSSAVITVADEPNRLSALRRELMPLLHLPGSASAGDLAHITLFRYAKPLRDPAALLHWAAATKFRLDIEASELLVIRERVYPSLDYEILHRIALMPASPAQQPATNSRSTIQRGSASDRRG